MAHKLKGELRLDLDKPVDANALSELLMALDEQAVPYAEAEITIQPAMPHSGTPRDPFATNFNHSLQLVATWEI